MSPFTIDATGGEIPLGQHDVTIVEAVPGTSSTGKPNVRLRFEDVKGRQLADWLTFTPAALWRWQVVWEAADLDWPSDGGEIDENDLVGQRVHINVIEDVYQGQARAKVESVSPPVGSDVPDDFDTSPGTAPAGEDDDSKVPF